MRVKWFSGFALGYGVAVRLFPWVSGALNCTRNLACMPTSRAAINCRSVVARMHCTRRLRIRLMELLSRPSGSPLSQLHSHPCMLACVSDRHRMQKHSCMRA